VIAWLTLLTRRIPDPATIASLAALRGKVREGLTSDQWKDALKGLWVYNIQCSEIFTLRNEKLHTEA
jgi:hypothetical protein